MARNRRGLHGWTNWLALGAIAVSGAIDAAPLHSVILNVPAYSEEALTWCGPATGQMIMQGYPSGSCTVSQEDVWMDIQMHKSESLWDTDPAGLRGALQKCPPTGQWSIFQKTDAEELMYRVALWMTRLSYPVAILQDTVAHNAYTAHAEHWVTIRGVITDVTPEGNPTVNLEYVFLHDPSPAELGGAPLVRFITGAQWYSEFAPVTKAGSSYHGKYVALIEPPQVTGRALAPLKVLRGAVIAPQAALDNAAKWIKEKRLYAMEPYKALATAKPLTPMLVNARYGGYYLVPYTTEGTAAGLAVLVNAYTGDFEEVGAFKPMTYLPREQAINLALSQLKTPPIGSRMISPQPEPPPAQAELVLPEGERVANRYAPLWKITVGTQTVGVDQQQRFYSRLPRLEHTLPVAAKKPRGMTWDGKRLWVVDEETRKLHALDARSGAIEQSFDLEAGKPKALAFDGTRLWVADEQAMQLHALNPATGKAERSIPLNVPAEKGFAAVVGLAWDGQRLWTALAAGFSSSFNQVDPVSGEIVRSIFADCDPRGLASDGRHLWSVCYNGDKLPPKLDQRRILDKESEMLRSRTFIQDVDIRDPSGVAFDGTNLWVVDRERKQMSRYQPAVAAGK